MNVCVQGLWHLGTVTAACLASLGHQVVGLDFDPPTIAGLKAGKAPLFEPGLDNLVAQGVAAGNLVFTGLAEEAVRGSEVLWITYDTPVDEDDNADTEYVIRRISETLQVVPAEATVLISSQLPVGSVRRLEELASEHFGDRVLTFACSPENLRLGKALEVFLNPDRIVVGVRTERDRERIGRLLHPIGSRIEWMSVESAEMTKHAINAFLATSVVFANEIASVCEVVGADAKEVERGLKSEARIGPKAYLSPGAAFSGGTLARDIAFLNRIGGERRVPTPLLSSVKTSNDEHRQWTKRKLKSLIPSLEGACIAVWGLTYKAGTDTLRRSMAVELCNWLLEEGAQVRVHDPAAEALPLAWKHKVVRASDPLDALEGTQFLVVCTEWPQYREIPPEAVTTVSPNLTVLDPNRFLSPLGASGRVKYLAVGTPWLTQGNTR